MRITPVEKLFLKK